MIEIVWLGRCSIIAYIHILILDSNSEKTIIVRINHVLHAKALLVDCSSWIGQARVYVPFGVLNLILAFSRAFRKHALFRAYNCEEPLAAVQRRTLIAVVEFAGRDYYT